MSLRSRIHPELDRRPAPLAELEQQVEKPKPEPRTPRWLDWTRQHNGRGKVLYGPVAS